MNLKRKNVIAGEKNSSTLVRKNQKLIDMAIQAVLKETHPQVVGIKPREGL